MQTFPVVLLLFHKKQDNVGKQKVAKSAMAAIFEN